MILIKNLNNLKGETFMFTDVTATPVAMVGVIGDKLSTGKVYTKPEEITNVIYSSYDRLISNIHRTIEVSAGIIWDTYTRWLEFKGTDPVKYASEINAHMDELEKRNPMFILLGEKRFAISKSVSEEIDKAREVSGVEDTPVAEEGYEEPENSFKFFCRSFLVNDKLFGDPQCVLNYEGYLRSVSLLRAELDKSYQNVAEDGEISIKFDIENSPEFAELNIGPWTGEHISFKVKPLLKSGDKFLSGLTEMNTIECDYLVDFDIRNLIFFIIENAKEVSCYKDKETYISYVMNVYGGLPERIARRICLEVYQVAINSTNNFSSFLQKLAHASKKISKTERFERIENLVCGFKHLEGNHILSDNIESFTNDRNIELINDILNNMIGEPDCDSIFDSTQFPGNLFVASNYKQDLLSIKKNIVAALFSKAFTIFFESAVAFEYYKEFTGRDSDYMMFRFTLDKIYREFDKDYDYSGLYQSVAKITDYNKRDFIKSIISEIQGIKVYSYDDRKMECGEKYSYMYSKNKRRLWLILTVGFAKLIDLKIMFNETLETRKHQMTSKDESIRRSIEYSFDSLFASYIRSLSLVGNKVGVPLKKNVESAGWVDHSDVRHIVYDLAKYTSSDKIPYTNGHHEQHKRIKTFINDKSSVEMKYDDRNMVMSFDPNDLSDNTSKSTTSVTNELIDHGLRKNLVEAGILNIEFLPNSE